MAVREGHPEPTGRGGLGTGALRHWLPQTRSASYLGRVCASPSCAIHNSLSVSVNLSQMQLLTKLAIRGLTLWRTYVYSVFSLAHRHTLFMLVAKSSYLLFQLPMSRTSRMAPSSIGSLLMMVTRAPRIRRVRGDSRLWSQRSTSLSPLSAAVGPLL